MEGRAVGDGLRAAEFEERAGAALWPKLRWRRATDSDESVRGLGNADGFGAKGVVEDHVVPPVGCAIEDRAGRNRVTEHFFKADRLGAELNSVDGLVLGTATLILDGEWFPGIVGLAVKLHNIGDAMEPECGGLQWQCAGDTNVATAFAAGFVGFVVQHATLGSQPVFSPLLLDVNERALPFAECEVLKRRDREGVDLGSYWD